MSRYRSTVDLPGVAIEALSHLDTYRESILNNGVYTAIRSERDLARFMELHVFAVWDFMSLLKSLQGRLTCTSLPWRPIGSPASRRFVNELVLAEESDIVGDETLSHLELYLSAMTSVGAHRGSIDRLLDIITGSVDVPDALDAASVPDAAKRFIMNTWSIVNSPADHCVAAAFALGRESLIPAMFSKVLERSAGAPSLEPFRQYLTRHIDLDADEHTPMALGLLVELCGDDGDKWGECAATVERCLDARLELWRAIEGAIGERDERDDPTVGHTDFGELAIRYVSAANAGSCSEMLALFSPDATLLGLDGAIAKGHDEIYSYYAATIPPSAGLTLTLGPIMSADTHCAWELDATTVDGHVAPSVAIDRVRVDGNGQIAELTVFTRS